MSLGDGDVAVGTHDENQELVSSSVDGSSADRESEGASLVEVESEGQIIDSACEDNGQVNFLQPEKLLCLDLQVGSNKTNVSALLDTGASRTILKMKFAGTNIEQGCINIAGIGGKVISAVGHARLDVSICGLKFQWVCLIVKDESMSYDDSGV